MHIETFPFPDWVLRRYHRSYGDKRDEGKRLGANEIAYRSQQADADMVYCFRYVPTGQQENSVPIKQPPTICEFMDNVSCCSCGYITDKGMVGKKTDSTGQSSHFKDAGQHTNLTGKQKRRTVLQLYRRFLTEASGVHIG